MVNFLKSLLVAGCAAKLTLPKDKVTEMCVDCIDGERSPTCWSTCHDVTKRGGFSLDDVLVKPYCAMCATDPSEMCWDSCYAARASFSNQDVSTMCAMCATDPSEMCWDSCYSAQFTTNKLIAKAFSKIMENQKPVAMCMMCATDPSEACWDSC